VAFSNEQLERYSRHIILGEIGVKGQKRLMAGSVLIIGAGGLGSPAALYLAASGVGRIGIADADAVEISNLQRQIAHATPDVGVPKVESARAKMNAINPEVKVETFHSMVDEKNVMELISNYDFIIDGTDNFGAKFLINDACVIAKKPFSHAGILRFQGQLITYVPGEGPCYRCLFPTPPPPDAIPTCSQAGVIGAMAGVIGCLQALEAVKYLARAGKSLTGALLTCDALTMEFRRVKIPARRDCAVCGADPTITEAVNCVTAPVCQVADI
jgi:molybdopterin/thiamine biosynthesis adenylyltransferase